MEILRGIGGCLIIGLIVISSPGPAPSRIPAFPGAEGFGTFPPRWLPWAGRSSHESVQVRPDGYGLSPKDGGTMAMQPSLTLVAAMLLNAAVAAEPPVAVTAQVQQTSAENAGRAVPRKPVISGRWRTLVSKAQIDNPDIQCGQIVEDRSYAGVKVAPLEWIEDAGPQHGSPEPQELKP